MRNFMRNKCTNAQDIEIPLEAKFSLTSTHHWSYEWRGGIFATIWQTQRCSCSSRVVRSQTKHYNDNHQQWQNK